MNDSTDIHINMDIDKKLTTLLTEEEYEDVIISLAEARENKDFTSEEAEKVLSWSEDTRLRLLLLGQVLRGDLLIDINNEGEISFKLSEQGKIVAKEIVSEHGDLNNEQ